MKFFSLNLFSRNVFSTLVVAWALVQCSPSTIETPSSDDDNSGVVKSGVVSPSTLKTMKLNQLSGLSSDGNNALKLQDVCVNSNGVVGIGIITTTVPVWHSEKLHTVETSLAEGFSYKNVFCGENYAFVVTPQQVARIDLTNFTETGLIDLSDDGETIWYENSYYDETHQHLFLQLIGSETESGKIQIYNSSTLQLVATINKDVSNIHIKSNGDFLLVSTSGDKKIYIYDGSTYALKSTLTLSYSFTKTAFNPTTNELWWFQAGTRMAWYLDLDGSLTGARSVSGIVPDAIKIAYGAGYVSILCENCYDTGDEGETRGGLTVIDATTKSKLFDKDPLYEHKSMKMSESIKAVVLTNNNNMSATLIELPSGTAETIDLGDGYEWFVVDKTGNLHLVNRLGGDTILSLDPENETVQSISALMWPLGLCYDAENNLLVTYNHLGNAISFYDVSQSSAEIDLQTTYNLSGISQEPELDALGGIVYDAVNGVVYVAVPEYNQLIIAKSSSDIEVMELPDYLDGDYSELKGPGLLTLAFSEEHQILFVHINANGTVYAYDAANNMTLIKTLSLDAADTDIVYPLAVVADKLYMGTKSYQLPDLTASESLSHGQYVVAIDAEFNSIFAVGTDDNTLMQTLYVIDGNTQSLLAEVPLWTMNVVAAALAYDEDRGLMYVLNMEASTVQQIQIYE